MQENERYRGLIETLLRHPAFTPFINDISRDPSVLGNPPQQQSQSQHQPAVASTPQPSQCQPQSQQQQQQQHHNAEHQSQQLQLQQPDAKPDFLNFDASQLQVPQDHSQTEQIGMAMVPETDFSKLNIHGFNSVNFSGFQSVNAFPVTDVPTGPGLADLLVECPLRASDCYSSDLTDANMTVLLTKLDSAAMNLRSV